MGYQHTDGSRRMRLQPDIDGEASFIQNILRILNLIVPGSYFPAVETFRMDCERYYLNPKNRTGSSPRATLSSQRDRRRDIIGNVSAKYNQALLKSVTFAPQSLASKEADAAMIAAQKDNFGTFSPPPSCTLPSQRSKIYLHAQLHLQNFLLVDFSHFFINSHYFPPFFITLQRFANRGFDS